MEELARDLHCLYHDDPNFTLGDLQDREVRDDPVVKSVLRMAYYLCDLAEVDADRGIGTMYYYEPSVPPDAHTYRGDEE